MGFPERFLSDDETIVRAFRPHFKQVIIPLIVFDVLVAAGVVVAVLSNLAAWIPITVSVLVGLVLVAKPMLDWFFTSYVITTERLIVRSGILSREGKEIPLEVINDVAFGQTIGERFWRSGDLLIESAGEMGQSHYSDIPKPEDVQSLIYQLREDRQKALGRGTSTVTDLATLAELHQQGSITDEEYAESKRRLLNEL